MSELPVEPNDENPLAPETTPANPETPTTPPETPEESDVKKRLTAMETELRQKTGALEEERRLRKAAEAAKTTPPAVEPPATTPVVTDDDKPLTRKEAQALFEEQARARDVDSQIKQLTADPDEQKLIMLHYQHSIQRTGDVAKDVSMALAIANAHLIQEAKEVKIAREAQEARMANFSGGKPTARAGKPAYEADPKLRAVANILDQFGQGSAKKYL